MSQSTGKLSHFWRELKRRKVLRSLIIYAGTAFIILEAVTIRAEAYLNTCQVRPFDLAMVYAAAGNSSFAMERMEKAYEDQDANISYVGINLFSKGPFKIDDTRLNELLVKMNLLLPVNP